VQGHLLVPELNPGHIVLTDIERRFSLFSIPLELFLPDFEAAMKQSFFLHVKYTSEEGRLKIYRNHCPFAGNGQSIATSPSCQLTKPSSFLSNSFAFLRLSILATGGEGRVEPNPTFGHE
jgi:hypothetical protein